MSSVDWEKAMSMKRFTRPFHQLRGKLTLSYTLTSVVTFLLLELLFFGIILTAVSLNISAIVSSNLKQQASQIAPYFVHGLPDHEELTAALHVIDVNGSNQGPFNGHPIFLSVVDTQGQTLASIGTRPVPANTQIETQLSPQGRANLSSVLSDGKGTTSKIGSEEDGTLVTIAPIVSQEGNLQGALVMKSAHPDLFQLVAGFLSFIIIVTVIFVTIIAAIAGSVFGYLAARGITRRLKRLSIAADRWGHGDFSALAQDTSEDELGQVARQLNRMAEQLQNLLEARQKLATLEERNRLARDLHDSVKQQIFAVSMQIGATKVLLKRDIDAAEVRLNEAEKLVHKAQQELTSLIRELRPVALEGKGLVAALRELASEWTQQSNIVANLRVEGKQGTRPQGHPQGIESQGHPQGMPLLYTDLRAESTQETQGTQTLPLTVEEALYRVAQEALANVARHSKATLVQMILTTTDETVTLAITDNGQGFDTTRQGYLGVGLLSMQERMKALGGDIRVESTPGKGTRVVASCKRLGVDTAMVSDEGEVTQQGVGAMPFNEGV
jgi:two-component system, NarL family, sensor histidine kinase LiaS